MAKEYIDYGYTGAISVTSEVKNVKDTFLPLGGINLTLRQTRPHSSWRRSGLSCHKTRHRPAPGFPCNPACRAGSSAVHRNGLYHYPRPAYRRLSDGMVVKLHPVQRNPAKRLS